VILSALTAPGVYECALRLIEDAPNATRLAAIAALGNVDDPRSVAQLEQWLVDRKWAGPASRALCRSPSAAALGPLRRLAHDGSVDAVIALAGRGDDGAVQRLRALMHDSDADYYDRARALRALGDVDPHVVRRPDRASTLLQIAVWYEDHPEDDPLGIRAGAGWRAWLKARGGLQPGESWSEQVERRGGPRPQQLRGRSRKLRSAHLTPAVRA
jgi:hypothetical protein